ncbi:MAG TPA: DUF2339 domain-containing protein [Gemmatimonadaceae bacterium]|nr:DUF2339 domain-containing protein [Gemmatimonadaceae bacterium]
MSPDDDRLAALERQVAALTAEMERLRAAIRADPPAAAAPHPHHDPFARASAVAAAIREEEIESLVGRYGTLLLGAFVLLMGVGVLIQFAVVHGLLTPAVRVGLGALVAAGVGAAGVYFHRRGEVRYANALLALALALTDLVAWGAGPRLHLVSTPVSFATVVAVALALAALALHDGSEFLFCAAVAGALSAPFVTFDRVTSPDAMLAFGAIVLLGGLHAVRDPRWERAFVVLVGGALAYALAATGLPVAAGWHSPFAVSLFGGACALGALLLAHEGWRSGLSRAFLAVALVGIPAAWDRIPDVRPEITWVVVIWLTAVTHAALAVRRRSALWTASALALPFVSLGLAAAWTSTREGQGGVFALWAAFSLLAWRGEHLRGEPSRGGAHLTAGLLLGSAAIALLLWPHPYLLVTALAGWGVLAALGCRGETRILPLAGVVVPLAGAALSAMDQLASRQPFAYAPFATRSSASALSVTVGLALAGLALGGSGGAPARAADRAVWLGAVIGFAILWGRMEVAGGWTPDVAAFLLIAYYAACGLGSILAGRRFGVGRLRLAGLALAIYAAVKAIVEASDIGGLLLRVGAYGAVGVFLLAAGYVYREARGREA